ncbi:cytosine-specific DNA methyltransferase [Streptomyces lydicamycinicus]|uniref:Cytosine-specific DNA methyltransferase n=1 Tax=Streptomyces lydicamycinicus TaxID=1546107 RepID=A0A0P4R712_9ACTN|nr:cytosine-specific DNA methyltransferase [Streptomyces lydicamycinicus]
MPMAVALEKGDSPEFPQPGRNQARQVSSTVPPRFSMHMLSTALRGKASTEKEMATATT